MPTKAELESKIKAIRQQSLAVERAVTKLRMLVDEQAPQPAPRKRAVKMAKPKKPSGPATHSYDRAGNPIRKTKRKGGLVSG